MVQTMDKTSKVKNWKPEQLPDLSGKLYVITGGNSGIGFEAAKYLGARGADLILACRSPQKAEAARAALAHDVSGTVRLVALDLADMASIRAGAEAVRGMTPRIDGLINNAGIMQTPKMKTRDGFELQFGTNHLGHFLWSGLLIDLVEAARGRVVVVSSIAHKMGQMNFEDLMHEVNYTPSKAYAQSKLSNLIFAFELNRRLVTAGSPVMAVACHPGYSNTNLQSTGPTGILNAVYKLTNAMMAQPQALGAVPTVLAVAGTEAQPGAYYGPTGIFDARGPVGDAAIAPQALVKEDWKRLWNMSEALIGFEWQI